MLEAFQQLCLLMVARNANKSNNINTGEPTSIQGTHGLVMKTITYSPLPEIWSKQNEKRQFLSATHKHLSSSQFTIFKIYFYQALLHIIHLGIFDSRLADYY